MIEKAIVVVQRVRSLIHHMRTALLDIKAILLRQTKDRDDTPHHP